MPDVAALLALYDTQLRGHVDVFPEGVHAQKDGPLLRVVGAKHGGFVGYRDLAGLDGAELDELIARQVGFFPIAVSDSSGSCTGTIGRPTSDGGCAGLASCRRTSRRW